jgi:hypothetical protein
MADKRDGQQPEALRSLEAAAQSGSRKPRDQGLEATGKTAPRTASLEQEEEAAARVLKAGTDKDPKAMDSAAKAAPKR